ncbi:hypothetical protein BDB00DRAFT_757696 [Zychaea mexicana]|uniref:uncharacterized protein n=1 Tax=Zychaea mexicana TaxID=64656 RepID=UPI0022FE0BDD|nr:uncharacterized protein BDB00DRAFT_757696 [Zychaea mexicana]KAI9496773.1 hypothetical protein BDB00DRAFT_757696 [Zychaea mexicana]
MNDICVLLNRKNVVLNYTEMEAKVHEATNNEAWGASSTLMQEIAQGTYNYQYFNEIMPALYKRFTEKEARQWRQIYKALVLLEYLVKNGSERVIDDARAHLSMIKIMRNFHYIDEKGKDQGINSKYIYICKAGSFSFLTSITMGQRMVWVVVSSGWTTLSEIAYASI